jgi:hypothetical protein
MLNKAFCTDASLKTNTHQTPTDVQGQKKKRMFIFLSNAKTMSLKIKHIHKTKE